MIKIVDTVSNYFKVSHYYKESQGLQGQNSFQLMQLGLADASTFIREAAKAGTLAGLVSLVSSVIFNANPTITCIALACTGTCGTSWFFATKCAQILEPQAQEIIKLFQELTET